MSVEYRDVLGYWFEELKPEQWFIQDDGIDREIADKFSDTQRKAAACELDGWRTGPMGRLAEIIVLDQFTRSIYRNQAQAFSCDPLALALAQESINQKADQELSALKRAFLYMPYMHSESIQIHREALGLFSGEGLDYHRDFEIKHKEIIERFGRFPHRNSALGRDSTEEELNFIKNNPNPYAR